MVSIQRGKVNEIPFLMAETAQNTAKPLPLVVFMHGYTSAKEHNLHYAFALAERGFRVILPDARHHGERISSNTPKTRDYEFWNIVHEGINDVGAIVDWALENGLASADNIVVGGISMGAIITYGSLVKYSNITAACALMGTPAHEEFARWQIEKIEKSGAALPYSKDELQLIYEDIRAYDLVQSKDKLNKRPLFIWHSETDSVIPYSLTKPYVEAFVEQNEHSVYMNDKNSGHKVSRPAFLNAVEWISQIIHANKKETV
jgi:uncharacterized protein